MAEWLETTLGEIGHVVTGKTPPTSNPENYGGDVPFVTPTDMDGGRYIDATGRTLTDVGLSTVWKAEIPKDSVLVSCIGSDMGKAAMAAFTCVTNQQINSIIVGSECDPKFVYYNLSARKGEIRLAASGSAQPILNKSAFSRLRLMLPPIEMQNEIAAILSCLDDKIDLNRRMNETLEAMARAIFKDWFVDFGPTRAKAEGLSPYLAPELWDLFPDAIDEEDKPVGWEFGTIGTLAKIKSGKRPSTKFSEPDGAHRVPVYGGNGISWYTNESLYNPPFLITGRVGTLGTVFRVYESVWVSDNALCCFPIKSESFELLYFCLKFLDYDSLKSGSTQPLLTQTVLKAQEVVIGEQRC